MTFNGALYSNATGTAVADNTDIKANFTLTGGGSSITSATYSVTNKTVTFVLAGVADIYSLAANTNALYNSTGAAYVPETFYYHSTGTIWNTDNTPPTIGAAFTVNNSVQPNTVKVVASEPLIKTEAETAGNWTITNNGGGITYTIGSAALASDGKTVTLTLAAVDPADNKTYITNTDAQAHIKVTMKAAIHDVNGVVSAGTAVTGAGETFTLDATAATVNTILVCNTATTYTVTFSEKVDKTTAETVGNYTLGGNGNTNGAVISTAELQAGGTTVLITLDKDPGQNSSETITVAPSATITDVAGVAITSSAATYTKP